MAIGNRWANSPSIGAVALIVLLWIVPASAAYGQVIQSDDFHSATLDSAWTFVDSLGDATLVLSGTNVLIRLPAGTAHTLWSGSASAPRLLQTISNDDFEVEVKFDSTPSRRYQMQGIVVHEDDDTFIRFEIHHDGATPKIFAGYVDGVNPPFIVINEPIAFVPSYLRVTRIGNAWAYRYSSDGVDWTTAATFTHAITVTQVGPFAGTSEDLDFLSPDFVANIDYVFNTAAPIDPEDGGDPTAVTLPVVDLWHGDSQSFGQIGVPQQWINILGTVWDAEPIDSMSYTLNAGPDVPLSIGPDGLRLDGHGDFNVEIDVADLSPGANTVVITALDTLGEETNHVVNVNFTDGIAAALPYTASFSTATAVTDVAQVVDGLWAATPDGAYMNPAAAGYDRCVAFGDSSWVPNYEVTVPFTIHRSVPGNISRLSFAVGWAGHTGEARPRLGKSYQALAVIDSLATNPTLILRDDAQKRGEKALTVQTETPYVLKMRTQTFAIGLAHVDVKIWEDGAPEPAEWDLGCDLTAHYGSVALFAGFAEATFGDASVVPLDPLGLESDDFSSAELDTSIWEFIDPVGDAELTLTGTNAVVYVPGGIRHDYAPDGNYTVRLMQAAPDTSFEVEVGFASAGSYFYQAQGVLVEEDADTYLRFEFIYTPTGPYVYAGYFDAGALTSIVYDPVAPMPLYIRVTRSGIAWTFQYSYDAVDWLQAGFFYQPINSQKVGVSFNNTDQGDAPHLTPAFAGNVDYFFNTSIPITPEDAGLPPAVTLPTVDMWYGDQQDFGQIGEPQRWVNILGTVWDTDDVVSLSYSLNGGPDSLLSIGPDGDRLKGVGDFNAEIDYADLVPGPNTVVISAVDSLGDRTDRVVTLNYTDGVTCEIPYITDWSSATAVTDVAQVADGRWVLTPEGARVAPGGMGYDRLLVMGDRRWPTEYEVVLGMTIHDGSGWSGVGMALGWTGHLEEPVEQAAQPFETVGFQTLAWVRSLPFPENPVLQIEQPGYVRGEVSVPMELGVKYILKMRSETISPGISHVRVKYWEDGTPEPAWMLSENFTTRDGSVLLVAHNADVTFGNANIFPLSSFPLYELTTTAVGGGSIERFPDYDAYAGNSTVKLTAVPEPGWAFQGWAGGLTGSTNPATITMVSDTTVSATFVQGQFTVQLMIAGDGSATIDPVKTTYAAGDTIVLAATPDPGHYFHSWAGDYESADNPDTLTVTRNMKITAQFFAEITGIDLPTVKTLTVLQNSPNPFSRDTYLHIGLPEAADVSIDVYDVAGRRVYSTRLSDAQAGWNRFRFNAGSAPGGPLASGVYFYRVSTPSAAVTSRMVIIR